MSCAESRIKQALKQTVEILDDTPIKPEYKREAFAVILSYLLASP